MGNEWKGQGEGLRKWHYNTVGIKGGGRVGWKSVRELNKNYEIGRKLGVDRVAENGRDRKNEGL